MSENFSSDIGSRRARWSLRKRFLEIMEELCPEVREDLRDQVWEGSRARYQEIKKQREGVAGTKAPPAVESDWLEAGIRPASCGLSRSLPSRRVDLKLRSPYHDLDVLFSVNWAPVSDSAFEDPLRAMISV